MKHRLLIGASLALFFLPPTYAQNIADIVAAMPAGSWYEVPNSQLQGAFPSKEGHPAWGIEGPSAVVRDWGGAAFDTKRNVFMITGGGHAAYGGNEVYEFHLDDLSWQRATEPSPYIQDPAHGTDTNYVLTTDGSPISSHTYDGLEYIPTLGKLFQFGGSQWRSGNNTDQTAHLFDPLTKTWMQGAKAPNYDLEVASAWDSKRNRVVVVWRVGLMAYDPAADKWTTLVNNWNYQVNRVAAYDPEHQLLLMLGAGNKKPIASVDLTNNTLTAPALTGDTNVPTWRTGLTYDSKTQQFVVWGGNAAVWTIDPDTWVATQFANTNGSAPSSKDEKGVAKNNGVYSRWQYVPDYDIFIGYNSTSDNVWLYKLACDTATTPPVTEEPPPVVEEPPPVVEEPPPATEEPPPVTNPPPDDGTTPPPTQADTECGADLCVGPNYTYKLPSQAAKAAKEGDTVYIEAGNYTDCTAWPVSVSIRGIHGRPHIGGKVCGGKGVWITQGAKITIENVELHGALGGISNAAAIRHEGKTLILRNVEIFNSHNGMLIGHDPEMVVEVYDSVFHHMNTVADLAHNIYAGKIGRFIAEGNYFYDGQSGHYIKTLAEHSTIAYNRFVDAKGIDAALVDIWGCSQFEFIGNSLMRVGPRYGSMAFVQITPRRENGSWATCPDTRKQSGLVAYNTAFFNNDLHDDPRWAALIHYNFPTKNVTVANNISVHTRDLVTDDKGFAQNGGVMFNNYHTRQWDDTWFVDPATADLHLTRPLPNAAIPIDFVPVREPALPVGTRSRVEALTMGAYSSMAPTK